MKIDVIVVPAKARSARARSNSLCLFLPHVLRTMGSQRITSIREFQSFMPPAEILLQENARQTVPDGNHFTPWSPTQGFDLSRAWTGCRM